MVAVVDDVVAELVVAVAPTFAVVAGFDFAESFGDRLVVVVGVGYANRLVVVGSSGPQSNDVVVASGLVVAALVVVDV